MTRLIAGLMVGLVAVLGTAAVIVDGVGRIAVQAPYVIARLRAEAVRLDAGSGYLGTVDFEALVGQLDLGNATARILAGVQEAASGTVLTLLFLILILSSKALIRRKLEHLVGQSPAGRLVQTADRSLRGLQAYVQVQALTGLMLAGASAVVMAMAGLDNVAFWAVSIFLLSCIPILGVAIGSTVPALFALAQFPTPGPALTVFLGVQVAAFIIGNLILPRMQAETQNIDPAIALLAAGVWTVLWGIPGAFLAVPITLGLMFYLAQHENLRWLAVLASNDGDPLGDQRQSMQANLKEDPNFLGRVTPSVVGLGASEGAERTGIP